jgi:hypothetical protein
VNRLGCECLQSGAQRSPGAAGLKTGFTAVLWVWRFPVFSSISELTWLVKFFTFLLTVISHDNYDHFYYFLINRNNKEKLKFSHYRPEQALGDPEGQGFRIFHDFRHCESGKVVTLTHRPSLPPGIFWYSFLEDESTPGHMVSSVATEKIPSDTTGDRSRDPLSSSVVS